ncbi:MAG: glycosyltransferase family 4 protein [Verrucomicrobiae bacterium]|nr:glycosyltransferase family 4 protein [Verrucomicrobiae bacterium]
MKIGIIKQKFVKLSGGSERYTTGLVAALKQAGHEIHVFTAQWDASAESARVTLHRVPMLGGFSFLRQWSFARNCKRAIERAPCDAVFSLERSLKQDIARAGGGCHREWLIQRSRYAPFWKRFFFRLNPLHTVLLRLERQTFSPANTRFVIANSHRGKEEIIRHYGFPADRMIVVHNGADCERFKPVPRPVRDEFVLLIVGSGFERKGVGFAIRALARLPQRVKLRVAGEGRREPYLRLAQQLGVADRVEFLGRRAGIEAAYADADVLVHPAIYEPFSNACLEALACGLPVVTSRINGASEVITPGVDGAVVDDPADSAALAAAIAPFLNPQTYAAAARAARHKAESLPFSRNVEQTLEAFTGLHTS